MSIAQICKREIVSIEATAPLKDAAALMRSRHVGALVVTVTREDRELAVGMITDRDLAIEALSRALDPGEVKVGQVASRHLASVPGAAGIAEAVAVMREAGVRRLLVTEQDGQLAGFVSSDDLLDALAAELSGLAEALRSGIAREGVERAELPPPGPRPVFLPHGTPGMQQLISAMRA
jgi:CBS domain-containing protein